MVHYIIESLYVFNSVEIKPGMVGHYLGEISVSYMPVKHGAALVFVLILSSHSSWLTMLKQIGTTHCKLSVEFLICTIHQFSVILRLHSISFVSFFVSVSVLGGSRISRIHLK